MQARRLYRIYYNKLPSIRFYFPNLFVNCVLLQSYFIVYRLLLHVLYFQLPCSNLIIDLIELIKATDGWSCLWRVKLNTSEFEMIRLVATGKSHLLLLFSTADFQFAVQQPHTPSPFMFPCNSMMHRHTDPSRSNLACQCEPLFRTHECSTSLVLKTA